MTRKRILLGAATITTIAITAVLLWSSTSKAQVREGAFPQVEKMPEKPPYSFECNCPSDAHFGGLGNPGKAKTGENPLKTQDFQTSCSKSGLTVGGKEVEVMTQVHYKIEVFESGICSKHLKNRPLTERFCAFG